MDKKHFLPELPYAYDALQPHISKEIMELHHQKHHAAYVKNLNDALEKHPEFFEKTIEELLGNLGELPEDIRTAVRNNGGGHVNHSMFWQTMIGGISQPTEKVTEEIKKYFGSFEEFQTTFNEAGTKLFGSGWVWLVKNSDGSLAITTTQNQDNPISQGSHPIMGNDVWEHAYYLQYKNVRADYLKAWWNVVNWNEVDKRLA